MTAPADTRSAEPHISDGEGLFKDSNYVGRAPTADILTADDHARGCAGREYACTCGYDERVADEIRRLRGVLTRIAEGHGRCAVCKTPCGTYTDTCDCPRPEWEPLEPSWEAAEALK